MSKKIAKPFTYHLAKAHIKGYKSIRDLAVEFNKGLTILIGKNGTGKSNFLEGLKQSMSYREFHKDNYKSASIELKTSLEDSFLWETELEQQNRELDLFGGETIHRLERLSINGKIIKDDFSKNFKEKPLILHRERTASPRDQVYIILFSLGLRRSTPFLITYNLPEAMEGIDSSAGIKVSLQEPPFYTWTGLHTMAFFEELLQNSKLALSNDFSNITTIRFLKHSAIRKQIIENLLKYTPIKDLRFSESLKVYKIEGDILISGIKLEFKVNNEWMPWDYLSDGTKRLFYLVAEVSNKDSGIVLIEEPELGVHPHQFFELMNFLKEQSANKQIIVSTHSPQACDVLNRDELINIRIATYDPKKGTQIKPMTKAQMTKAHKYMDNVGSFSDFWMHSPDFEV